MTTPRLSIVLSALLVIAPAAFAQDSRPGTATPLVPLASGESRPASKPKRADIYDTKTDGKEIVAKALKKAAKDDKRVLVVFGGNWCGWCHKLHDLFAKNREISKQLSNEYEVAWIDIGNAEKPRNEELVKSYVEKLDGVPYLTVLDSAGKVLANQETGALEEGDHHDPAKVKAFLTKCQVPGADAEKAYADALAKAKAESKTVFFHVGAPWCPWCHVLEDFIARPEIAKILETDFVMLKIDDERMVGGKELETRLRAQNAGGGIPWIAFVDGEGKTLATSDAPKGFFMPENKGGNIGYPSEPEEIAWFMDMVKKVKNRTTPDQLDQLESALKKSSRSTRGAPASRPASRPGATRG